MPDLRSEHTGGSAPDAGADEFERRPGRTPFHLGLFAIRRRTTLIAALFAAAVIAAGTVATLALRGTASPATVSEVNLPQARVGAAMAYDSVAGLTVMYGGYTVRGTNLYDTWTWNGSGWRPYTGTVSPHVFSASLADDPADGGVLLVGAAVPGHEVLCAPAARTCVEPAHHGVAVAETWLFTGGAWHHVNDAGDSPRAPVTLATVPSTADIVAVADTTDRNCRATRCPLTPDACRVQPTGDSCLNGIRVSSWSWSGRRWTANPQVLDLGGGLLLVPSQSGSSLELVSVSTPAHPSCINADGGCPAIVDPPRAWKWFQGGWVEDTSSAGLPPLQPGEVATNGVRAVLLGRTGRAWRLADGTWTEVGGVNPVGARSAAGFAVDRVGDGVLFGGTGPQGGAGNDTWVLSPGGWHHVSGSGPTPTASDGSKPATAVVWRCETHATRPQYLC